MQEFAIYFFMSACFVNMFIFLIVGHRTKRVFNYVLMFFWLDCLLWGMTLSAINVPWIKTLNEVVIPISAGFIGVLGGLLKLQDAIHDNQI